MRPELLVEEDAAERGGDDRLQQDIDGDDR
jgi:hypothetical protein